MGRCGCVVLEKLCKCDYLWLYVLFCVLCGIGWNLLGIVWLGFWLWYVVWWLFVCWCGRYLCDVVWLMLLLLLLLYWLVVVGVLFVCYIWCLIVLFFSIVDSLCRLRCVVLVFCSVFRCVLSCLSVVMILLMWWFFFVVWLISLWIVSDIGLLVFGVILYV